MSQHRVALGAVVAAAACGGMGVTHAQPAAPSALQITRVLSFETLRLPGGEHMGLVGGAVLFDIDGRWAAGPAVYGAATGQRGGLFVGGIEVQRLGTLARVVDGDECLHRRWWRRRSARWQRPHAAARRVRSQ